MNYMLLLSGMYLLWHTEPIEPLSEPRGFPDYLNQFYKEYFDYNEYPEGNRSVTKNALFHAKLIISYLFFSPRSH
jgi:hypothetical protein